MQHLEGRRIRPRKIMSVNNTIRHVHSITSFVRLSSVFISPPTWTQKSMNVPQPSPALLTSSVCASPHVPWLTNISRNVTRKVMYLAKEMLRIIHEKLREISPLLTHWGRVTQICVFNTRLFSLHNILNYAMHTACLRMVLLTDVYSNLTSLWIIL